MNKGFWFVECDPVSNEHLAEILRNNGIGVEAEEHGRLDVEGKPHDVWAIPSKLVTRLRRAKKLDKQHVLHQFKFFIAGSSYGRLHSASFIEKKRRSKKFKKINEDLKRVTNEKI